MRCKWRFRKRRDSVHLSGSESFVINRHQKRQFIICQTHYALPRSCGGFAALVIGAAQGSFRYGFRNLLRRGCRWNDGVLVRCHRQDGG
ncbi:hypothetical protein KCP77_22435 [Salmonella enterica subsp. enterica]|nr:hypothetical protein KCP77_22435 [Salmonella enterica subsp. enterica]